jgi:hypothetical protein
MKNTIKFLGITALVVVVGFSMASCSRRAETQDGSGGGGRSATVAESPVSDFQYDLTADGQGISIRRYTGEGGKVVIPARIEGFPVVEIGANAFFGRRNLTEVVIPDTVRIIGAWAFYNNSDLTTANLPASIEVMGKEGETLGHPIRHGSVFELCRNLTTLHIPDSLTSIEWPTASFRRSDGTVPPNRSFESCGSLPLATRQRLRDLGYTDEF